MHTKQPQTPANSMSIGRLSQTLRVCRTVRSETSASAAATQSCRYRKLHSCIGILALAFATLASGSVATGAAAVFTIPNNVASLTPTRATTLNMTGTTTTTLKRATIDAYLAERQKLLDAEHGAGFESDTPPLNRREQLANDIIMAAKQDELDAGFADPQSFAPAQHFFDAYDQIRASKLFKIIRRMPKGGLLHGHDTGLASIDFLVSVTYRANLWQRSDPETGLIVEFRFAREAPQMTDKKSGSWMRTSDERQRCGAVLFDRFMRKHFTMRTDKPRAQFKDINEVWKKFMSLFILVEPLVTYVPVWRDYYAQTLKEALEDNVQYVEFRGLLPAVYDLDGNQYSKTDIVQMYVDVLRNFQTANPEFIGSKFVYAPLKAVPNATFEEYAIVMRELSAMFPDFVAGFDLVGQEDTGRTLISFAEHLLQLPDEVRFFFHAGETNWFGRVDENLVRIEGRCITLWIYQEI